MKKISIINGPNLDRLGKREPEVYGTATLADLENRLTKEAAGFGAKLDFFQSNHEGAIIDHIATLSDGGTDGIILNGAGFTHTSVALRDAIAGSGVPTVEVHISNIHAREEFRKHSVTGAVCIGVITGLGFAGYSLALRFLVERD